MKQAQNFTQSDQLYILVRLLIMVKAEDIFFYSVDEYYLNILLNLYYVNRAETKFGLVISEDGNNFIAKYSGSILPSED